MSLIEEGWDVVSHLGPVVSLLSTANTPDDEKEERGKENSEVQVQGKLHIRNYIHENPRYPVRR